MRALIGRLLTLASVSALLACGSGGGAQQQSPPPPSKAPLVRTLSPTRTLVGSGDLTLKVGGLGFQQSGQVRMRVTWTANGASTTLSSTVSDDKRLTAVVPSALLASPTSARIVVAALDSGGQPLNLSSLPVDFRVELTTPAVGSGFNAAGDMNTARSGHSAALLPDGKVLIVGGADTSAEIFDPATRSFTPTGSMSEVREAFSATLLANGKVLVAGGWVPAAAPPPLKTAELYDPATGTFAPTGRLKESHAEHTATALPDGRMILTGGGANALGAACQNIEDFSPSSGEFSATGTLVDFRAGHTATPLFSGEIFIAGGWNGLPVTHDAPHDPLTGEILDPATHVATATSASSTTRHGHAAVRLGDGKVLVLGGIPDIQDTASPPASPRHAEVFDPVTSEFSAGPDVSSVQRGHTASMLPDGQVLFVGGEEGSTAVADAKLIDVEANQVVPTASLATPRKGHTATVLSDGRVLITGGTDASGKVLKSAEIFE